MGVEVREESGCLTPPRWITSHGAPLGRYMCRGLNKSTSPPANRPAREPSTRIGWFSPPVGTASETLWFLIAPSVARFSYRHSVDVRWWLMSVLKSSTGRSGARVSRFRHLPSAGDTAPR